MRQNRIKIVRKVGIILISVFMVLIITLPVAKAQEKNKIRIGYVFSVGYQEGGEGEFKTGLGYDYYQKISYYTGWNYEYVYGGFGELLEKLKTGDIDIMGNLSYTDERAKFIDFSEREQGYESYYLYTLEKNNEVNENRFTDLNNKKIGITKGSVQLKMFSNWCKDRNIECEIIEYADRSEREGDLENEVIYGTVAPTVLASDPTFSSWRAAVKIGDSPYYFGVSKYCDKSIKEQLDMALSAIYEANPYYFTDQFNKYYGGKMMESDFWTEEEEQLLAERNRLIKVGYLNDYLPFCNQNENGVLTGLLADILQLTSKNLDISFESVAYSSYTEMKNELQNGKLDVIFPVRGDYWAAEQQDLFISDIIIGSNSILLYQGQYDDNTTKRIAISDVSPFQRYGAMINFPNAELLECATIQDCIEAVQSGKADSTIFQYEYYKVNESKLGTSKKLQQIEIADNAKVCFGVNHGNTLMLSICEKWLRIISDEVINQFVVANSNIDRTFTLREFIEVNSASFLTLAIILIIIVVIFSVLYVHNARLRNRKLLEATKEAEKSKRELIEQELKAEAYKLKTDQELNESRTKVMMSQIKPHFLYNALSAIQTIVKVDPDYASSLISDFTRHLRSSITVLNSDKPIPFVEELKNISAYLNIEKMRTGDALKVVYDIQFEDFEVYSLSIQPFAENAARHGVYPKGEEGGTVIIRSYQSEDANVVEIKDDGIGFDVNEVLNKESASIGLKNTIFRLETLLKATVTIDSKIGFGTNVTIIIPKSNVSKGEKQ